MQKILAVFLCLSLILSGCVSSRTKQAGVEVGASISEELSIGKKIHEEILSSFYVYTEPSIVGYVNDIGKSLTDYAERDKLPYQFTVLYSEKIYATSAPGGYVYVTTGMINFLQNEAEFAAVLAHEIGQLQYRDPRLSRLRKALAAVTQTGAAIGPAFGQLGALAVLGLVMVNAIVDVKEKTPQERISDADAHALQYLVEAGYDPQGLVEVLAKFLNADKDVLPYFYDYYQARPVSQERLTRLEKEFMELPLADKELTTRPRIYQEMTKGIRQMYQR